MKRAWKVFKRVLGILFLLHLLYLFLLKWIYPPITIIQFQNWVQGNGLSRNYVELEEISRWGKLSVLAAEDQRFPVPNGFDWESIKKVVDKNRKSGKRLRGASTISQQVAKNVFLWGGRSWIRKGLESYFTFMIERIWGKRRILEMYLNVVEMGKGVFGIEAAAQHFFKKPASRLSSKEAAMIAASLPNPKVYTVKPISKYVRNRYPWIVSQMNYLKSRPEVGALINEKEKQAYFY